MTRTRRPSIPRAGVEEQLQQYQTQLCQAGDAVTPSKHRRRRRGGSSGTSALSSRSSRGGYPLRSAALLAGCTTLLALGASVMALAGPGPAAAPGVAINAAEVASHGHATPTPSASAAAALPFSHQAGSPRNSGAPRTSNSSGSGGGAANTTHGPSVRIRRLDPGEVPSRAVGLPPPGITTLPTAAGTGTGAPAGAASTARLTPGRNLLQYSSSYGGSCCSRLPASSVGFNPSVPLLLIDTGGAKVSSKDSAVKATICSCRWVESETGRVS
jgi:hypothetical protein